MDAVVTTRLHGLVLALKNEVPALPIDPIAGGAKLVHQTRTLGWPIVFTADAVTDTELRAALDFCLSPRARARAGICARRAVRAAESARERFLVELKGGS